MSLLHSTSHSPAGERGAALDAAQIADVRFVDEDPCALHPRQQRLGAGVGAVVDEDHLVARSPRVWSTIDCRQASVRSAPENSGITSDTADFVELRAVTTAGPALRAGGVGRAPAGGHARRPPRVALDRRAGSEPRPRARRTGALARAGYARQVTEPSLRSPRPRRLRARASSARLRSPGARRCAGCAKRSRPRVLRGRGAASRSLRARRLQRPASVLLAC